MLLMYITLRNNAVDDPKIARIVAMVRSIVVGRSSILMSDLSTIVQYSPQNFTTYKWKHEFLCFQIFKIQIEGESA